MTQLAPTLSSNVAIGVNRNIAWIVKGETQIAIEDLELPPEDLINLFRFSLAELKNYRNGENLLEVLYEQDFIQKENQPSQVFIPAEINSVDIIPLVDILQMTTVELARDTFIYVGNEGLYLPASTSVDDLMWSLRLFTSGLTPEWRRRSYGLTVATKQPCVHGDVPSLFDLVASLKRVCDERVSSVVSFDNHSVFRLHELPGRLSIVQQLTSYEYDISQSKLWLSCCIFPTSNLNSVNKLSLSAGWGASEDIDGSRIKAMGEAVERFASGDLRADQRVIATETELDGPFLPPDSVMRLSDGQLRRNDHVSTYDANVPNSWVRGTRVDGTPVYVLAQQVYYPLKSINYKGQSLLTVSSSGAAAHTDRTEAQRNAYLELVERDAVMATWLLRHSRELIDLTTIPKECISVVEAIEQCGWNVQLINITQGDCPVILAVGQSDFGLLLGAAAGDSKTAVLKALREVWGSARLDVNEIEAVCLEDVKSTRDHVGLFRHPEYREYAKFLASSSDVIPFKALEEMDEVATYKPSDQAVFLRLDHSYPGLEHFEVWRCIDPELIPITFGYDNEPLGHPRLAGLVDTSKPLIPHPFP